MPRGISVAPGESRQAPAVSVSALARLQREKIRLSNLRLAEMNQRETSGGSVSREVRKGRNQREGSRSSISPAARPGQNDVFI